MNNIGMIQKWILLFTNGLYYDLFEDYKEYLNNHLKPFYNYIAPREFHFIPLALLFHMFV